MEDEAPERRESEAGIRLNKAIADSGYCARRKADSLIAEGRVRVPAVTNASHPAFGAAALAGAREWRFAPPQHQGRSVQVITERTVRFTAR